jgi:hypothetical protein
MDEIIACPKCRQPVSLTDYFCPNCGKNIRPRPLLTSLGAQIWLYVKALLLPPMGFIWGYRYLRQPDTASKLVGLFTILITIIEIVWMIQETVVIVNTVNQQIFQQSQLYGL